MSRLEASHIESVNAIANFLAHVEIPSLLSYQSQIDVIVLCGNSILPIADHVFSALEANSRLAKCLVICGGIGHSTGYLYEAVGAHPKYRSLVDDVRGLPEARVLELVRSKFYDVAKMEGSGLKVIIEDQSTNCGANAYETRRVLDAAGITSPEQIVIVQDPTMSLRTRASFEKVYADHADPPRFETCPTFIPKLAIADGDKVEYDIPGLDPKGLWSTERFLDLVMGEIPRLRDVPGGYGPCGKGFIVHVDIPDEIEQAFANLESAVVNRR
jgi:uncharacterized SAM-binding protein YcdF (DUF218 family)